MPVLSYDPCPVDCGGSAGGLHGKHLNTCRSLILDEATVCDSPQDAADLSVQLQCRISSRSTSSFHASFGRQKFGGTYKERTLAIRRALLRDLKRAVQCMFLLDTRRQALSREALVRSKLQSAITAHLRRGVLLRRLTALLQVALVVVLGREEDGGGLDLRDDGPGVPGLLLR